MAGTSTGRVRYVSLNTTIKPFDNADVRKAITAAMDRNALRQKMGGPLAGDIPTHFLPPDIPGFSEAGGLSGPGDDFLKSPTGNLQLAQSYMRKAGYPSGRYTGGQSFLMVADNSGPTKDAAQVVQAQLGALGFKITPRFVTHDSMYTKFCNVPKQKVPICPSTGWQKDFPDPEFHAVLEDEVERLHGVLLAGQQLQLAAAEREVDQRDHEPRRADHRPHPAGQGVGGRGQADHRRGARSALAVGQGHGNRVQERPGRDEQVQRGLGSVVHVAEVAGVGNLLIPGRGIGSAMC